LSFFFVLIFEAPIAKQPTIEAHIADQ